MLRHPNYIVLMQWPLQVYLKLVTKVDDNGVAHWGNINPFAILEKLEATDLVILKEKDEATGVGVGAEALDELWFGARRVVADLGAKSWTFGPIKRFLQVSFLQPKILTQQVQELLSQFL
jgi:hypothetical protein